MPCWCFATSASTIRNCAISRRGSARLRSAGGGERRQKAAQASQRSATSPTSTRTAGCARSTTGAGSTASATGCGTPMPPTCRCRWCWACCTRSQCRRRALWAAARPNSPICARPTTRLAPAMREAIDGLVAEHDIFWSRGQIGFTEFAARRAREIPAVAAAAGAPPSRLGAQDGLSVGPRLAHRRLAGGRRPHPALRPQPLCHPAEFVYSHQWRIGDLVIWDNRSTMHRGRPHDDGHPRDLRRATTLDAGSTLDEAA